MAVWCGGKGEGSDARDQGEVWAMRGEEWQQAAAGGQGGANRLSASNLANSLLRSVAVWLVKVPLICSAS